MKYNIIQFVANYRFIKAKRVYNGLILYFTKYILCCLWVEIVVCLTTKAPTKSKY